MGLFEPVEVETCFLSYYVYTHFILVKKYTFLGYISTEKKPSYPSFYLLLLTALSGWYSILP